MAHTIKFVIARLAVAEGFVLKSVSMLLLVDTRGHNRVDFPCSGSQLQPYICPKQLSCSTCHVTTYLPNVIVVKQIHYSVWS